MNVIKVNVSTSSKNFWKGLKIYYERPKSINKEVIFSVNILFIKLESDLTANECQNLVNELCTESLERSNLVGSLKQILNSKLKFTEIEDTNCVFDDSKNFYLLIRKLIPKSVIYNKNDFLEFFFLDKLKIKTIIFTYHIENKECNNDLSKLRKLDPFVILKYSNIEINFQNNFLELYYNENIGKKELNWLEVVFIKKFSKLLSSVENGENVNNSINKFNFQAQINVVQYYELYEKMKEKYAKNLIENWTENTNANKFVYEDIGIATYLMMLWNGGTIPDEGAKKQTFVDLGCGNGLLVHILNSEGHFGVGLDLRKRKIWDMYGDETVLMEKTIIPSIDTVYPKAEWLIGNHSDELTAWIPIMAKRSNNFCQYFVLPCCPYQLNGKKFQRKNSGRSCYQDFIMYVKHISEICGFETYVDKLRIPSTKRICLIGCNKPGEDHKNLNDKIISFIKEECQSLSSVIKEKNEVFDNFQPISGHQQIKIRDSVEPVRNCTKLPSSLIDEILLTVMNSLLKNNLICEITKENKTCTWNRGEKLSVSELAGALTEDHLKHLKKECKGLQTLLKNHHFLFEVNKGFVQFRSPENLLQLSRKFLIGGDKSKWKKRRCWFHKNHPDECPLDDEVCSYTHNA